MIELIGPISKYRYLYPSDDVLWMYMKRIP